MPKLAYILSASHSGSTLLAMLLGSHPEACTAGELKASHFGDPENYRCACRLPIRQCEFWLKVRQAMAVNGVDDFDITCAGTSIYEAPGRYSQRLLAPLHRNPGLEALRDLALGFSSAWRRHRFETQRRNCALVKSLLSVTGAKVVIDSSKVALRLKYLLNIPELEIKVIRLIRDGRAVSLTYLDEANFADAADPTLRNGGTGNVRRSIRSNMTEAAREWRRSNEAADCLVKRLAATQWIQVRYEDLCANPRVTLEKICTFLDLDPALINLDFRSKPQHVVGNGMRLDSTAEIRLDERWKQHLSPDQVDTFERVAGHLNRKYGYQG